MESSNCRVELETPLRERQRKNVIEGTSSKEQQRRNIFKETNWKTWTFKIKKSQSSKKRRRRRNVVVGMSSWEFRRRSVIERVTTPETGSGLAKLNSKRKKMDLRDCVTSSKRGSVNFRFVSRFHSSFLVTTLPFSLSRRNAFAPPSLSDGPIRALGTF